MVKFHRLCLTMSGCKEGFTVITINFSTCNLYLIRKLFKDMNLSFIEP